MKKFCNIVTQSVWIHCPYGGYPIAKIEWSKDGKTHNNQRFGVKMFIFQHSKICYQILIKHYQNCKVQGLFHRYENNFRYDSSFLFISIKAMTSGIKLTSGTNQHPAIINFRSGINFLFIGC